jgi:hypothetical protein
MIVAYHAAGFLKLFERIRIFGATVHVQGLQRGLCQSTRASPPNVLRDLIHRLTDVYVVLDALDECVERHEVLRDIRDIVGWRTGKLHLLVTSRREDIEIQ